jgi:acetyl-CoA acyltransferase
MSESVWIAGINMTKFGRHPALDSVDLAFMATSAALADAQCDIADIEFIAAGELMNTNGVGQRLQKQIGQTGCPVINVANACATGATALRSAVMAIKAGEADVALAVGVEKLAGVGLLGQIPTRETDEYVPAGRDGAVINTDGELGTASMPGLLAQVGTQYADRYPDATFEIFAAISAKNHAHSALNPLATYNHVISVEDIMRDKMIAYPNTRSMCSANCDGAAAAVLISERRLASLPAAQRQRAIRIAASVLTSDPWTAGCQVLPDMNTLTRKAAEKAYEQAGLGPDDLDLVELHDCFATAELLHYENLMLCAEGGAVDFFNSGAPYRDGRLPVNVSGGLESKGHPIAATGIANVWEICQHLRHEAKARQIEGARVGLAHVFGLGSSAAVHILTR